MSVLGLFAGGTRRVGAATWWTIGWRRPSCLGTSGRFLLLLIALSLAFASRPALAWLVAPSNGPYCGGNEVMVTNGIMGNGTSEQVVEWVPQCYGTPTTSSWAPSA